MESRILIALKPSYEPPLSYELFDKIRQLFIGGVTRETVYALVGLFPGFESVLLPLGVIEDEETRKKAISAIATTYRNLQIYANIMCEYGYNLEQLFITSGIRTDLDASYYNSGITIAAATNEWLFSVMNIYVILNTLYSNTQLKGIAKELSPDLDGDSRMLYPRYEREPVIIAAAQQRETVKTAIEAVSDPVKNIEKVAAKAALPSKAGGKRTVLPKSYRRKLKKTVRKHYR